MTPSPTRRDLLAATTASLGALAGCDGFGERDETPTPTDTDTETATTTTVPRRSLELRNQTRHAQFVSVAVLRDGRVLGSATVEVGARSSRTVSLPAPPGILDIELETTAGRTASHPWVVGARVGVLVVTLTSNEIQFGQWAWCTPECAPLSTGGTAADFPYASGPVSPKDQGSNVVVENETPRRRSVDVQIRHDGTEILRYGYVLPPAVSLELPAVRTAGDYTVTLRSDGGRHTTDWTPTQEHRLRLRLTGDGIRSTCGRATASFVLRNEASAVRRVDVGVARPSSDHSVIRRFYELQPDVLVRDRAVYTGSGRYRLTVSPASGDVVTVDWWLCPPLGPTEIVVEANGDIRVVQHENQAGTPTVDSLPP